MSRTQCIITGCALLIPHRCPTIYYWGDLHRHSAGAFVFHAVVDERGRAKEFSTLAQHHPGGKGLVVTREVDLFEQRGVFVLPADPALLSAEALAYIERYAPGMFVPMDARRDAFDPLLGQTQFAPMRTRLLDSGEETTL